MIIPAIDLIDGACVRLRQGDFSEKTVYSTDPLEQARIFEDFGFKRLHIVDLDATQQKKPTQLKLVEKIAARCQLDIDLGGGMYELNSIQSALDAGAKQVVVGSAAIKKRKQFLSWVEMLGEDQVILGLDVREGKVASSGWTKQSKIPGREILAEFIEAGGKSCICTDIARDGMLSGPALSYYRELLSEFAELKLIASGGIASSRHLKDLQALGCSAAVVGKAIYENSIKESELKKFI
jgi:phosphoribosylformimino-5-aminoimidazole carboxamide ribotide isomerase